MSDPLTCLWCTGAFQPRRGGTRQTFCQPGCRAAYHKATRQWCERAIADGRLTIEDLRNGTPLAYTLPGGDEPPSFRSEIKPIDNALLGPVQRFLVEVPQRTVEAFVRFGWLRGDQQSDLLAILDALKRLGETPNVSRLG